MVLSHSALLHEWLVNLFICNKNSSFLTFIKDLRAIDSLSSPLFSFSSSSNLSDQVKKKKLLKHYANFLEPKWIHKRSGAAIRLRRYWNSRNSGKFREDTLEGKGIF